MTTTAKRKKPASAAQSTDRGGAVVLPLGILLIAWGFMMLLGITLQTSAMSLQILKNMALGLGGGLSFLVPLFVIWLGVLFCVSSKRYVSFYPFVIALLILMSLGALLTLLVTVAQENQRLMGYIQSLNALVRKSPYPQSMGEYINAAYHQYYHSFASAAFLPGGGVVGMLLAYPLWITLGDIGAMALLIIMLIGLIFAFLRVSPVKLAHQISHQMGQRKAQSQPVPQQANYVNNPEAMNTAQHVAPEYMADPVYEPAWPSAPQPQQESMVYANDPEDSSFVAAPAAEIWEDPVSRTTPIRKPVFEPVAENPVSYREPMAAVQEPGIKEDDTAPVAARNTHVQDAVKPLAPAPTFPHHEAPVLQAVVEEVENYVPDVSAAMEDVSETPPTPVLPRRRRSTTPVAETKQVGTEPAVALSGARVAIPKKTSFSELESALDGTPVKPAAKQIKIALDDYQKPPAKLLMMPPPADLIDTTEEDQAKAEKLLETLKSFSIPARLHDITHGPTVTRFAIRLAEGVNVRSLRSVMDNLTIELKARGEIRAETPIPGTSFVGLEVSNDKTTKVYLSEVLTSSRLQDAKSPTVVALGKDITGSPISCELMELPHLLIAGATGSGKSVCINSIICSILYRASPRHVRLMLIDPKFVELQPYNDVPHLLMPVITDPKKATMALDWICKEMDNRYQILQEASVRNLDAYNRRLGPDEDPIPRIVVIVDEMADLMTTAGKVIEDHIKRITAKARAAGICLILATQRPSVNIITGVIKANIPGRIAFRVASPFDSKTILDEQGAEKLLGYGDMLFRSTTRDPIRVQGCFVSDQDVEQTVEYIRNRNKAEYNLELIEYLEKDEQSEGGGMGDAGMDDSSYDSLLPDAIEMAVESGQMSISMLQRVLRVGYARAGRLIDEMARRGIISGNEGTKARKTLMSREQYSQYLEEQEENA